MNQPGEWDYLRQVAEWMADRQCEYETGRCLPCEAKSALAWAEGRTLGGFPHVLAGWPTDPSPLWTIYGPDGQRVTVATFYSRVAAEHQIVEWQDRQRRGKRPDVDASDLYADVVRGTYP